MLLSTQLAMFCTIHVFISYLYDTCNSCNMGVKDPLFEFGDEEPIAFSLLLINCCVCQQVTISHVHCNHSTIFCNVVVSVIITPPTDLTVVSPDSATFNCTATANPRAVTQWTRNGIVLNGTMGSFVISYSTEGDCIITDPPNDCVITSTLDINDIVPNNNGEYVCTAINAAGNETASVSLIVHGKYSLHRPNNCRLIYFLSVHQLTCNLTTSWVIMFWL